MANNIKKYINVHYDVTPYFKVSPKNVVIYWSKDPDGKQVLEKHFVVETNLGGLKAFQNINGTLKEKASGSTVQVGGAPSRLEISYDNTPDPDGKYLMKVTETKNPVTITVYNFTLKPLNQISGDEIAAQEVTVTVKPEFGPYRIYMRAINNFCSWDGKPTTDEDLKVILKEQKKNILCLTRATMILKISTGMMVGIGSVKKGINITAMKPPIMIGTICICTLRLVKAQELLRHRRHGYFLSRILVIRWIMMLIMQDGIII